VGAVIDSHRASAFNIELPRAESSSSRPLEYSTLLREDDPRVMSFLTPFGLVFREAIKGRIFIDLASGYPNISQAPAAIAARFGASEYIGVDHLNIETEMYRNRVPLTGARLESFYFRRDILSFMSQFQRPSRGMVIHIAGLEPSNRSERNRITRNIENLPSTYLKHLLDRFEQIMSLEDSLVIGPLTKIDLSKRAFIKKVSVATPRGEYQLWQKEPPKVWPKHEGELRLLDP